ncbi:hypothetical protein [Butyrivibrio sp.]|uniref:hypothetical protein n=1 Tax=Butyrivibrio sp. TaxID=28121 RepID=UPI0025C3E499|nr:hypothetical protein [Butyrivibrio sp.]MBE5837123.1 hypothetical protein [Butyrivibrio sp.]
MQKKFLVSLTATATAFSMLVAPSLTAFAEDAAAEDVTTPINITSDSEKKEVVVESVTVDTGNSAITVSTSEGSVTVNEDVNTSGSNGTTTKTYTDGEKTYNTSSPAIIVSAGSVDVGGNVNATGDDQTGIDAYSYNSNDKVNVTVDGKVSANGTGIYATGKDTTVEVGSVNSGDDAISAFNGSTVIVNGDAISTGAAGTISSGDYNKETKQYEKETESYYGSGIDTDGSSNIFVDGNVIGVNSSSISIYQSKSEHDNNEKQGSIIITGTISNSDDNRSRISFDYSSTRDNDGNEIKPTYKDVDDVLKSIPELTIYEMDKGYISVGRPLAEDANVTYKDVYDAVVKTINYIINQDTESQKKYGLKLTEDNENVKTISGPHGESYDTVNIKEAFKVAANVPEGYEVTAGENVTVTNNGDGTFTLVLDSKKGGINVKVTAIVKTTENTDGSQSYEVVVENVTPSYADPAQAPAGAIVVSNTVSAADTPSQIAAISGTKPARTVSYNMSSITPIQYKESIISNVAAAPQGGAMNIETDRVACLDSKMIAAIASRPDIDVNVVFTYGGKKLKVTIPAGYDVNSLLDEYGYCGFLRLMSILGSTEL